MNRADFLKGLIALPLALKGLSSAGDSLPKYRDALLGNVNFSSPLPDKFVTGGEWYILKNDRTSRAVRDAIEWYSGGLRIQKARLEILPLTGTAEKRRIVVWDHRGLVRARVFMAGGTRSEWAYLLAKRAKEIAHDMAHWEWGDDWRRWVHKYQVENRLYG